MSGKLIDGKAIAAEVRAAVAADVKSLQARAAITPGLAVVRVGKDAASEVYVNSKVKLTREAGMLSEHHHLPADTSQDTLMTKVADLNADPNIHGILVQLPLPDHLDADAVIRAIAPEKDVDGFHPINAGLLASGLDGLVPCTPLGCMKLINTISADLSGKHAVVVGRSNIVGKPMAQLLLAANATVTIAHSRTKDLADVCRRADVLVAAVGRPEIIKGDWVKEGAIVIDVGINRVAAPERGMGDDDRPKTKLVGDVEFSAAAKRAAAITPVPGGVGPMTIALLLANTVTCAKRIHNL